MDSTAIGVRPLGRVGAASSGMGYVFISHSRWDRLYASRLVTWLRASGIPVWISGLERHCPVWQDSILPNIAHCSAVVVLMTPRSELAVGVHEEICYAKKIGKPVIPLFIADSCFLEGRDLMRHISRDPLPEISCLGELAQICRIGLPAMMLVNYKPRIEDAIPIISIDLRSEGCMIMRSSGHTGFI